MRAMMARIVTAFMLLTFAVSPIAAQIDPSARGLAVQAQSQAAQAQTLALGRDPLLWTDIGDSRADADFINPAQTAFNARSAFIWARALTGQRFVVGPTFGKSGDRTDQFFARVPLVLATQAGGVHIIGCVNDIAQNYPTASTSGATCAANIISMSETFRLAGMKVIIELEVGATNLSAAQVQQVHEANQRLADYQESATGVYLSDARAIVMNPTASTTTLAFKPLYSLDGTHEVSRASYYHALATLVPIFNTILPPRNVLVRSAAELPTNGRWQLLLNPIFATATGGTTETTAATGNTNGTTILALTTTTTLPIGAGVAGAGIPAGTTIVAQPSGGGAGNYTMSQAATATASAVSLAVTAVQGTAPSGWGVGAYNTTSNTRGQATGTIGTQPDADGVGNNVTLSCTWVNAGDGCRMFQTVQTAYWALGDIVQAVAQVQITGPSTCLAAARLNLLTNGTTAGTNGSSESQDGYHATVAGSVGPDQSYTVTLMTRPYKVPAFDTKGYMAAYIYLEGACAGTVNTVIKQVAIKRRLSAPNG